MSEDNDLVVTSVDPLLKPPSKEELKRKLLGLLAVSLPPVPLSYSTFEAHIKAQCKTYYDCVIKEVFQSLQLQLAERYELVENGVSRSTSRAEERGGPITISSDDDSEPEGSACGVDEPASKSNCLQKPDSSPPVGDKQAKEPDLKEVEVSATGTGRSEIEPIECDGNDSHSHNPLDRQNGTVEKPIPTLNTEGMIALKAEKSTKKYTRYLQETYDLIKNIEGTSSCSVCCKLKRRIHKFVSLVGKESAIIQQHVAKELRVHNITRKPDLTECDLEKLRMSILIDKLIEVSLPDILTGVQKMERNKEEDENKKELNEEVNFKHKKKRTSSVKDELDVLRADGSFFSDGSSSETKKKRHKKKSEVPSDAADTKILASVNETCLDYEEKSVFEKKKNNGKEKRKVKDDTPITKARKISIKITDSNHPDLT